MELQLLFSAYNLMMLYICKKFRVNIWNGFKVIKSKYNFHINNCKGTVFGKKYMELQFLFSANCLVMFYICTKFCENIFNRFKVMERTCDHNYNTCA